MFQKALHIAERIILIKEQKDKLSDWVSFWVNLFHQLILFILKKFRLHEFQFITWVETFFLRPLKKIHKAKIILCKG